ARNDMLAASFGLLAFYLYERAEEKKRRSYYIASGVAAGAGVMCHTNLIYMLIVILALLLMRRGWRMIREREVYLFSAGALVVMAYELIYDVIDYRNFVLQNRKDTVHFQVLEPLGWWRNLISEPHRYVEWYEVRGVKFAPSPELLHFFMILSVVAFLYLAIRRARGESRRALAEDPRNRLLASAIVVILFFALVTQRKVTQYVVHLAPWLALMAAVMVSDAVAAIRRLSARPERWAGAVRLGG